MNRIKYLDSLRGLAAFSVVIYHILNAHWGWTFFVKMSHFIFNGSDAVSLFFVLSGLVLSFKYLHGTEGVPNIDYKKYVVARFFRLYPVYLVVIGILYVYLHRDSFPSKVFITDIFKNNHHLVEQVLLVRGWLETICTPAWTLAVEIVVSLLVPMFIITLRSNKALFYGLIPLVIFANKNYLCIFIVQFLLGIILAENFTKISTTRTGKIYQYRYLLLFISCILFSWRPLLIFFPLPDYLASISNNILYLDTFLITGIGAFGIIAFIIHSEFVQNILSVKPLLFLGKISYSIYLSHWIFTTIFMDKWEPILSRIGEGKMIYCMSLIVIIGTLLFSTFLYYVVEKPFIQFGKKVAARISKME